MLFTLKNSPTTFQRSTDVIIASVEWQFVLVYLNHFIVFSNNAVDHINQVGSVSTFFKDSAITLKLKTFHLSQNWIKYLCHYISPVLLEVSWQATDSIKKLKNLTNITDRFSDFSTYSAVFL